MPRLILSPFPKPAQSGFRKGGGLEEGNLKGIIPLGFPSSRDNFHQEMLEQINFEKVDLL